ncbi:hypothetical protein DLAC_10970 [Tieghemostelium lacteum]|uniref:Ubiquitin-like protease family profile domain-containing protein n=1 Tax=Tieghemostelium lacteum TaxID=361077 RepID=A0A151Z2V2_TIELA|nr:hypothetical protein DLAC_10970 [Tieghemostelium lacteum]|eukprot:KYQ88279.1 hypothetical protein DLAC_10970 [Tieghemostelium lacteum]
MNRKRKLTKLDREKEDDDEYSKSLKLDGSVSMENEKMDTEEIRINGSTSNRKLQDNMDRVSVFVEDLKNINTITPVENEKNEDEDIQVILEEGTEENPLSLSSDEDEDYQDKPFGDIHNSAISENSEVDKNKIELHPKTFQCGNYPDVILDQNQPIQFKENEIVCTLPYISILPSYSSSKKYSTVTITIANKQITSFQVTSFKTSVTISCIAKEFTFTKDWLSKPKPMINYEQAIPNEIVLKNISREEFILMKPYIELQSPWIKMMMEIVETSQSEKVIAEYPHFSTYSIKENNKKQTNNKNNNNNNNCTDNDNNDSNSNSEINNNNENRKQIQHNGKPFNPHDIVKITANDLKRLEPKQYLNDSIIDFYLRYIMDYFVKPEDKEKIYFYNTFFYKILTLKSVPDAYHRIAKWTKDIDIFSFDFLFIPICENFHWTLCIISFAYQDFDTATSSNRPTFIYLDSLDSQRSAVITKKIRQYLSLEWKNKKSIPSNGLIPEKQFNNKNLPIKRGRVPKQDNLCDCGVFLLHYAELFCRAPEKNFDEPLKKPDWFKNQDINDKREIIKTIIKRLALEQSDHTEDADYDDKTISTTTTTTTISLNPKEESSSSEYENEVENTDDSQQKGPVQKKEDEKNKEDGDNSVVQKEEALVNISSEEKKMEENINNEELKGKDGDVVLPEIEKEKITEDKCEINSIVEDKLPTLESSSNNTISPPNNEIRENDNPISTVMENKHSIKTISSSGVIDGI